jgi:hypothetical protein
MNMIARNSMLSVFAGWALLAAPAVAQAPNGNPAAAQAPSGAPGARPPLAPGLPRPPVPRVQDPTPTASGAKAPTQGAGDASGNVKVERGAGGKKVYKITTEIRIEGKIQKPEAFYVLQKSSINYEWQDLKQDFLPKILDSVSQAPF